jgi:pimeloyl-ACP methyl ester carboxylesterase
MPAFRGGMNNRRWIFLRGLTRGNVHWGKFPEILKTANPDIEFEFLEIPGNGYLNNEKTPTDIKAIINLLRSRSKICQQNLTFNLCGISLGGMISLKWAEIYPQNIESVTIINSSLKQFSPFYHRLVPANYMKILRAIVRTDVEQQERIILQITSNNFNETKSYLESFSEFASKHKISKLNITRQLILANKINIKITNLPKIPLKIIVSQNDNLVSALCSSKFIKELGGTLYCHPTAGHDLPLDDPNWLVDVLINH